MSGGKVFLRGLRLSCRIGLSAEERAAPRTIELDIDIFAREGDSSRAADGAPTIDYAAAAERLRALAESREFVLLEDFAEDAAAEILARFPADAARISCAKPGILPAAGAVGVEIFRRAAGDASRGES